MAKRVDAARVTQGVDWRPLFVSQVWSKEWIGAGSLCHPDRSLRSGGTPASARVHWHLPSAETDAPDSSLCPELFVSFQSEVKNPGILDARSSSVDSYLARYFTGEVASSQSDEVGEGSVLKASRDSFAFLDHDARPCDARILAAICPFHRCLLPQCR